MLSIIGLEANASEVSETNIMTIRNASRFVILPFESDRIPYFLKGASQGRRVRVG